MKTFVSTKIGPVMDLLAGQVATVRFQEGLAGERPPFGGFVYVIFLHPLGKNVCKESRDTDVLASCFNPGPAGDGFFKREGDVSEFSFHDTILVLHETSVNPFGSWNCKGTSLPPGGVEVHTSQE